MGTETIVDYEYVLITSMFRSYKPWLMMGLSVPSLNRESTKSLYLKTDNMSLLDLEKYSEPNLESCIRQRLSE